LSCGNSRQLPVTLISTTNPSVVQNQIFVHVIRVNSVSSDVNWKIEESRGGCRVLIVDECIKFITLSVERVSEVVD
jgi:hypothetical protein